MKRTRTTAKSSHVAPKGATSLRSAGSRTDLVMLTLLALAVAVIVLIVHWPVLSAQAASFDDEEAIVHNTLVQNPSMESVRRFFSEVLLSSVVRGYYRPLTLTSLMLDWAMGGRPDNFRPFHRTSLVLHIGSTLLLILLVYQIFRNPVAAALAGLLFGVHPLTVEPIAWVMERKTILAAFFAFGCLNAYVRFTQVNRRGWYAMAVVCYLLSLLAKPTSTPLALILLLMDYWPLKRFSRRTVLEKIPFFVLSISFALLCVACERQVNPLYVPAALSPMHLPLRLCWLTVFYPCKILLPIHLSSVYLLPKPLELTNPIVLASVAGTLVLISILAISRRWSPAGWVGAAILYVGLAPTMGIVGYSWVAASDKYVYLPAAGLILALGRLLDVLWLKGDNIAVRRRGRATTVVVVIAIAGLFGLATRRHLDHWQTTDKYLDYMLYLAPESANLHNHKGVRYSLNGDQTSAIAEYTQASQLDPGFEVPLFNRGLALASLGRNAEAIRDFSTVIEEWGKLVERQPSHIGALIQRAAAYIATEDYPRAIQDLTTVLRLDPHNAKVYFNRAYAHKSIDEFDQAIEDYTRSAELDPRNAATYYGRGNCHLLKNEPQAAIQDYDKAIAAETCSPLAYANRAVAYERLGDPAKAAQDSTKAIELKPDHIPAYTNRAISYLHLGDFDRAWADVARCRELGGKIDPNLLEKLTAASGRTH